LGQRAGARTAPGPGRRRARACDPRHRAGDQDPSGAVTMAGLQQVLVGGAWRDPVEPAGELRAYDPTTGEAIGPAYPVSGRREVEQTVAAAMAVAEEFSAADPERIAGFLEAYAAGIEAGADALVALAHAETGLPVSPRLRDVELPRTTGQIGRASCRCRPE